MKKEIHERGCYRKTGSSVSYTAGTHVEMGFQLRVLSFVSGKIMSSYPPNLPDKGTRAFSLNKEFVFVAQTKA